MCKHMLVFLAFCAAMGNANATTVIAVREPTFLMFAADSKEVRGAGNTAYNDSACKIFVNNGIYWSAAGMVAWPDLGFSVRDIIAKTMGGAGAIRSRIDAFSQATIQPLTAIVTKQRSEQPTYYHQVYEIERASVLQTVFATFDDGLPILYVADFRSTVDALTNRIVVAVQTTPVPNPGYAVLGYNEAIAAVLNKMADAKTQIGIPQTARDLINLEIAAHPTEVSAPIALVMIDKEGPHWISRGACKPS